MRSLRPLRVINRAPGLKLVVQTLLSSLRPIGNIVLICCTFFIIFGILGVQLFKGAFFYCDGPDIKQVRNKTDCLADKRNVWLNRKYNFDDLGKALMSLFVLSSRDGWVNIMYTGLDAVGVDQQVHIGTRNILSSLLAHSFSPFLMFFSIYLISRKKTTPSGVYSTSSRLFFSWDFSYSICSSVSLSRIFIDAERNRKKRREYDERPNALYRWKKNVVVRKSMNY